MRIFGSKVIALCKEPRQSKFGLKRESYLLVGYSEESKAYRLWKLGTKRVIKRRDVHFNKKFSEESTNNTDYFEALLNISEISPVPQNKEVNEDRTENDPSDESEYEDPMSSNENEPTDINNICSIK